MLRTVPRNDKDSDKKKSGRPRSERIAPPREWEGENVGTGSHELDHTRGNDWGRRQRVNERERGFEDEAPGCVDPSLRPRNGQRQVADE